MKRICIYVALGVLGAFSAHAQEINIGQTVARKISVQIKLLVHYQ